MSDKPKCQVLGCDKNPAPSFDVCYQHLEGAFLDAFRTKKQQADLATRVAADLFAHAGDFRMWCEEEANATALKAVRFGRIFAEAVAKEGK